MEEKPTNNKPSFSPEQLKQLLSLQKDLANVKRTRKNILSPKTIANISKAIQNILYYLDRFINFVTKKTDAHRNDVVQVARSPILFGTYVIIFFVLIGGIWGSCAPLDSAAVAGGIVIASSNRKTIQHQEGGIVANIFVNLGDNVKVGDKLVELEDSKIRAQYEGALSQYRHALAVESRCIAELDGKEEIIFSELLMRDKDLPEVATIIRTQENLFRSKKEGYISEKNALSQRIEQLNKKIEGYIARKAALIKNLETAKQHQKAVNTLHQKGFANKATLLDAEGKEASGKADISVIESDIASSKHAIAEMESTIMSLQNKFVERTLSELKEAQVHIGQMKESVNAYKDSLSRVIIRSPVDGSIIQLNVHTIGGVVGAGAPILEIAPTNDTLIIEAQVPSRFIDSVHEGLVAKIRFSAFKSRTTPLFMGKVVKLSPDVIQSKNQKVEETVYIARIEIDMEEFNKVAKARNLELHPGMQAEVQIVTGTRTLLRYLLDPITDTMFRSFKEK